MPTNLFISYRHEESAYHVGRLHDRLVRRFGRARVFKDVDSIELGDDFREVITERVAACNVFIAIIGKEWISVRDSNGVRRLDNPDDFVRIEIEAALSRDILVIPVLVGHATVPRAEDLPASLRNLSYRKAQPVRPDPDFHPDMDRLIRGIKKKVAAPKRKKPPAPRVSRPRPRWPRQLAASLVVLWLSVLVFGVTYYLATDFGRIQIKVNDLEAVVFVDKQDAPERPDQPITLRVGEHRLSIKRGNVLEDTRTFVIRRGDNLTLNVVLPVIIKPHPPLDSLFTNAPGLTFKRIAAGEFAVDPDRPDAGAGDVGNVNGKPGWVRIAEGFYLGTTEVTVGQFRKFVEATGYKTDAERDGQGSPGWNEAKCDFEVDPRYTWRSPGFPQNDNHPVVLVSWNDAVAFCDWLNSLKDGKTYRLPTDAEWSYTCWAGHASLYNSEGYPELLATVGNVADEMLKEKDQIIKAITKKDGYPYTAPVGSYSSHSLGLFDMIGNVWEWCSDDQRSGPDAPMLPEDAMKPVKDSPRVMRGGGWSNLPKGSRPPDRNTLAPGERNASTGFRVAAVRSER